MALELEDQVKAIDKQQDDTGTTADSKRLVVSDGIVAERSVKRSRQQQTHHSKRKHDTTHLSDSAVVDLLLVL